MFVLLYCKIAWRFAKTLQHRCRDTITYGENQQGTTVCCYRVFAVGRRFSAESSRWLRWKGKNFRLVNEIFNNETFPASSTKDVFTLKPPHVRTHLRRREYIYAYNKILQYVNRRYIQYYARYIYIHVGVSVCVVRRVDDEGAAEWQERRCRISICTFELLFFWPESHAQWLYPPVPSDTT